MLLDDLSQGAVLEKRPDRNVDCSWLSECVCCSACPVASPKESLLEEKKTKIKIDVSKRVFVFCVEYISCVVCSMSILIFLSFMLNK
jgi:hypothetical protein